MCNIPHAYRRAGRYTFRRRVHFRNLISTPLSIALGTADPKVARMRADVMGHAREGTNGKHYSKRMATEGLDVVLAERRAFIKRYVPAITSDVDPQPIRLLPIEKRSRVGAGISRKRRRDAGVSRAGDLAKD